MSKTSEIYKQTLISKQSQICKSHYSKCCFQKLQDKMCSIYEHQKNLSFISGNPPPFLSVSKMWLPEWNLGELHQFLFLNGQGHISDSEVSNGARLVSHISVLLVRYSISAEELRDRCCKVKHSTSCNIWTTMYSYLCINSVSYFLRTVINVHLYRIWYRQLYQWQYSISRA